MIRGDKGDRGDKVIRMVRVTTGVESLSRLSPLPQLFTLNAGRDVLRQKSRSMTGEILSPHQLTSVAPCVHPMILSPYLIITAGSHQVIN